MNEFMYRRTLMNHASPGRAAVVVASSLVGLLAVASGIASDTFVLVLSLVVAMLVGAAQQTLP